MHHNMVCLIGMLTLAKKKLCWYNTLAHLLFLACDLNIFCWRSKAFVILKRQFTPKCILTCSAIYPSRYFWCEVRSFGDINCRDVCFLSSMMALMEIVGTGLMAQKQKKKKRKKLISNVSFELCLLTVCEGNMHRACMDKKLVLIPAWDGNMNGLFGWAVMVVNSAGLVQGDM